MSMFQGIIDSCLVCNAKVAIFESQQVEFIPEKGVFRRIHQGCWDKKRKEFERIDDEKIRREKLELI